MNKACNRELRLKWKHRHGPVQQSAVLRNAYSIEIGFRFCFGRELSGFCAALESRSSLRASCEWVNSSRVVRNNVTGSSWREKVFVWAQQKSSFLLISLLTDCFVRSSQKKIKLPFYENNSTTTTTSSCCGCLQGRDMLAWMGIILSSAAEVRDVWLTAYENSCKLQWRQSSNSSQSESRHWSISGVAQRKRNRTDTTSSTTTTRSCAKSRFSFALEWRARKQHTSAAAHSGTAGKNRASCCAVANSFVAFCTSCSCICSGISDSHRH